MSFKMCLKFSTVTNTLSNFVPKHRPVKTSDIDCFNHFILKYDKILVLTGAGISTESGIPDYRSEGVGLYARSNHKPMQYQDFLKSPYGRKRYWARNFAAWPRYGTKIVIFSCFFKNTAIITVFFTLPSILNS